MPPLHGKNALPRRAPTVYGDRSGMGKIIRDRTYGEIVGGHIVAPKAAELIEELVIARELAGGYTEARALGPPAPRVRRGGARGGRATDGWLIHRLRLTALHSALFADKAVRCAESHAARAT